MISMKTNNSSDHDGLYYHDSAAEKSKQL